MRAICMIIVLLSVTPARADDSDRARLLAAEGLKHYRAGQYQQSIEYFVQAYALAPRPSVLFNIAQAQRLAGRACDALRSYNEYLRAESGGPNQAVAVEHAHRLAEQCSSPSPVPVAPAPAPAPVASSPSAAPLANPSLTLAIPAQPRKPEWPGWLLAGTGAGAAIIGGGLLGWAVSDYNHLHDTCAPRCQPSSWASLEKGESAGYALIGIGAAALTGGIVWLIVNRPPKRAPAR